MRLISIVVAVSGAANGDVVAIPAGTWRGCQVPITGRGDGAAVTLAGAGAGVTIIDCEHSSHRAFSFPTSGFSAKFVIEDLTVRGGGSLTNANYSSGGCMLVGASSDVTLQRVVVESCSLVGTDFATYRGGAIRVQSSGQLTLIDTIRAKMDGTTITGCVASGDGGGVFATIDHHFVINGSGLEVRDNYAGGSGGGLYIVGETEVSQSAMLNVSNNVAEVRGGGVCVSGDDVSGTFNAGVIAGNSAGVCGGGMAWWGEAEVEIRDMLVSDNSAVAGGGLCLDDSGSGLSGTLVEGVTITNNVAATTGGGVYIKSGEFTFDDTQLLSNTAVSGSGVFVESGAEPEITNSFVSGNLALEGGAFETSGSNGTIGVSNTVVCSNIGVLVHNSDVRCGGGSRFDNAMDGGCASNTFCKRSATACTATSAVPAFEVGARYAMTMPVFAAPVDDAPVTTASIVAQAIDANTLKFTSVASNKTMYHPLELFVGSRSVQLAKLITYVEHQCYDEGFVWYGSRCRSCSEFDGAFCPGGTRFWPLAGYWSPGEGVPPTRCQVPAACPGALGERDKYPPRMDVTGQRITAQCATGFSGEFCSTCATNYYKEYGVCRACGADDTVRTEVTLMLLVASVYFLVVLVALFVLSARSLVLIVSVLVVLQQVVTVCKVGLQHLSTSLSSPVFPTIVRVLSIINFEVEVVKPGCTVGALSFTSLYYGTIGLICFAGLCFIGVVWLRTHSCLAASRVSHLSVVLPLRLNAELRVVCYEGEHVSVAALAWVVLVTICCGFPVWMFFTGISMFRALRAFNMMVIDMAFESYGFLLHGLKPPFFWFRALQFVSTFAFVTETVLLERTGTRFFATIINFAVTMLLVALLNPFRSQLQTTLSITAGLASSGQLMYFLYEEDLRFFSTRKGDVAEDITSPVASRSRSRNRSSRRSRHKPRNSRTIAVAIASTPTATVAATTTTTATAVVAAFAAAADATANPQGVGPYELEPQSGPAHAVPPPEQLMSDPPAESRKPGPVARPSAAEAWQSRWKCRGGSVFNRTCLFENVVVLPASDAPDPEKVTWYGSENETSLLFDTFQPHVHGHAIFDGLYSHIRLVSALPRARHVGKFEDNMAAPVLNEAWPLFTSSPMMDPDILAAEAGTSQYTCFPALATGLGGRSYWSNDRWCNISPRQSPELDHPARCDQSIHDGFVGFLRGVSDTTPAEVAEKAAKRRRDGGVLNVVIVNRLNNRKFVNIGAIEAELNAAYNKSVNIQVVAFERLSIAEQAMVCEEADIYVAYAGSSLANTVFLPPHSVVIIISSLFYETAACGFDRLITDLGHYNISYIERRAQFVDPRPQSPELYTEVVRWFAHEQAVYGAWQKSEPSTKRLGDYRAYSLVLESDRIKAMIDAGSALVRGKYPGAPTPGMWAAEPLRYWNTEMWRKTTDRFDYGESLGGVVHIPPNDEDELARPLHEAWGPYFAQMRRPDGIRSHMEPRYEFCACDAK
ncbi:uncharacterized protein AMSG_00324 [Thecamonas trahens ATCC 50062]|uniref:Glycosyltransferase 61 catalytic domain-containing protein n=1 Tax=Thecamonas trahens ATCC 50062 TaxID=461836 RepID=A0A0L0D260_THETB|nr:hypothetical protein AMSG_00324 [Thecamonas trahens ATCC 50062]KNC46205.1 hypothetical protein AMSG_00324 [Thecamonas trahens ATCC 50062]|eukprot:XP_013763180.1 hypothetical protein AMSG_00324 [Thecamonas trahens ATCC 50062]